LYDIVLDYEKEVAMGDLYRPSVRATEVVEIGEGRLFSDIATDGLRLGQLIHPCRVVCQLGLVESALLTAFEGSTSGVERLQTDLDAHQQGWLLVESRNELSITVVVAAKARYSWGTSPRGTAGLAELLLSHALYRLHTAKAAEAR
jgi:hypothetical protein